MDNGNGRAATPVAGVPMVVVDGGRAMGEPRGAPEKKFLSMDAGSWAKTLVGLATAIVMALALWQLAVRDQLGELHHYVDTHSRALDAHPETTKRIEAVEKVQGEIRASQIRQEGIDERQTAAIERLAEGIDRIR